jgi:hypothetical protein
VGIGVSVSSRVLVGLGVLLGLGVLVGLGTLVGSRVGLGDGVKRGVSVETGVPAGVAEGGSVDNRLRAPQHPPQVRIMTSNPRLNAPRIKGGKRARA